MNNWDSLAIKTESISSGDIAGKQAVDTGRSTTHSITSAPSSTQFERSSSEEFAWTCDYNLLSTNKLKEVMVTMSRLVERIEKEREEAMNEWAMKVLEASHGWVTKEEECGGQYHQEGQEVEGGRFVPASSLVSGKSSSRTQAAG